MITDPHDHETEYAMETEQLRTFTTLARTGNFTVAARELGYVQSTVTGHLQALEQRLGVRLLDRLPAGAVLTAAGTRLLGLSIQLLDLETRIAGEVANPDDRPAGPVRLIAPESLCAYRLLDVLAAIRAVAPDIRLTLVPGGTAQALHAVRNGACEGALLLEPALTAANLTLEPLGTENLALLMAPGSDVPTTELSWSVLAERDVLLLEEGCSYSDHVAQSLLAAGQPQSRQIRFGSIEAVKRCVAAGLGWTVLPVITVEEELEAGSLIATQGPLPTAPTSYLVTNPGRSPSRAAQMTFDEVHTLWRTSP